MNITTADTGGHEYLLGFMGIGFQELLVILLIVLILFGAKRVPELAKGLGAGLREFKKAAKELESVKDGVADGRDSVADVRDDGGAKAASAETSSDNNKSPDK